ncbi:MAG: cupin domain-containing protein [Planctomycetota bacterium]|nr:MAG: cupin domain-containing protein [Planctomycetota bacterium]
MSTLKLSIVAAAILAAAAFALAQTAGGPPQGCPDPSKCPVSLRAEDIKWEKAFPDLGADGPDLAVVHVNPKTQATQLLVRATKQAVVPWHWHTPNEAVTVMKGTFTVECEGKKIDLGPGSFTYTPSRLIHRATFTEGSMIAISADGPFDIHWAGAPPAAKEPGETTIPKPAGSEQDLLEIQGVPIEAVEVAPAGRPGEAAAPGQKVTDPAGVKRILGALKSGQAAQGAAAPSGTQFRWVLTLHAGKGGYTHQVWVLESGEWGFGGETRGRSADLPGFLGDLAGK